MRKWLLSGTLAIVLAGGGVAFVHAALSEPAPQAATPDGLPPSVVGPNSDSRDGMTRWTGRLGGPRQRAEAMHRWRNFALVYRAPDRNLSGADVQRIAEGFLLWNGNHTWKVVNVQEQGDQIAYSLATPDGDVIASFTMDRHTARVERTG